MASSGPAMCNITFRWIVLSSLMFSTSLGRTCLGNGDSFLLIVALYVVAQEARRFAQTFDIGDAW